MSEDGAADPTEERTGRKAIQRDEEVDGPSPTWWLNMLLTGQLGSLGSGPALYKPAPDFTLRTFDGQSEVKLASFRGKKPVVLVFGSFT